MSHEEPVKSPPDATDDSLADDPAASEPLRWWKRRPELGIAAGLLTGIAGLSLLRALGRPTQTGEAVFLYMVTLPIALLLPALSLLGILLVRTCFSEIHGKQRFALAVPAVAAALTNVLAIGMFLRFVLQIFAG